MKRSMIPFVIALVALAGCGGGTSGPAGTTSVPKAPNAANVSFVVKIPPATNGAQARRPHWIPSSVQFVQIGVVQNPTTSLSGSVGYAVNSNEPYCTGGGTAALVCTLALQAPPGNDVFTVSTYDSPTIYGSVISTGSVTAQIAAGVANTINISTGGVVAQIYASIDNPCALMGHSGTFPINAIAADADNNIIIGNYDMPLTVTNADTTGSTALNETAINGSSDLAKLALTYNGASTPSGGVTITATSPYSPNVNASVSALVPGTTSTPCLTVTPSMLVLAGSSAPAASVTAATVDAASPGPYTGVIDSTPYSFYGQPTFTVSQSATTPGLFTITPTSGSSLGAVIYKDTTNNVTATGFVFVQ